MARSGSKVCFIEDAIPGDVVEVDIVEDKPRYAEARVRKWLTLSTLRDASSCAVSDVCGGCQWQGVNYEEQLKWKSQFVSSALRRIGQLQENRDVPVHPSPNVLGFRHRIHLQGRLDENARLRFGYFRRRSHDEVPIDVCPVSDDAVNAALQAMSLLSFAGLPSCEWHFEIQSVPADTEQRVFMTLFPKGPGPWEALVARLRTCPHFLWVGMIDEARMLDPYQFETHEGLTYFTAPGVFQQVNVALNHLLRRRVAQLASEIAPRRVLDVFCGSGNLSLQLAKVDRQIYGVEASEQAIRLACAAQVFNDLPNCNYFSSSAEAHLWKCARGGDRFDLIIVDPPREGMYREIIPLKKIGAGHIIYVSCDPTTLARDLGSLCKKDYKIVGIEAFDFFPNTFHVETLVTLARQG